MSLMFFAVFQKQQYDRNDITTKQWLFWLKIDIELILEQLILWPSCNKEQHILL